MSVGAKRLAVNGEIEDQAAMPSSLHRSQAVA